MGSLVGDIENSPDKLRYQISPDKTFPHRNAPQRLWLPVVSQNGLDSEGYPAITNRPSDRPGGETGVLLGSSGLYVHSIRSVLVCQGVVRFRIGSSWYQMRYTIRLIVRLRLTPTDSGRVRADGWPVIRQDRAAATARSCCRPDRISRRNDRSSHPGAWGRCARHLWPGAPAVRQDHRRCSSP